MKLKVDLFFIFLFFIFSANLAFAQNNNFEHFDSTVTTTYLVDESGQLEVSHDFNLKNLSYLYFLKKYQLSLPTEDISGVSVDSQQEIMLDVNKSDNETLLSLNFQSPLVGEAKINKFKLKYQDLSSIQRKGEIFDLFLHNLAYENSLNEYSINLKISKKFAKPTLISTQFNQEEDEDFWIFSFNNFDQLSDIYVRIGNEQRFDFNFSTNLENDSSYKKTFSLAIPADDDQQTIIYQNIDPEPDLFEIDNDNNWIISYFLKPLSKIEVSFAGQVIINDELSKNNKLDENQITNLTKAQVFWESDNQKILDLANFLKNPEEIYFYLKENLSYSSEMSDRLGALKSLEKKEFVNCQSFSDLGVAILRAKKIPARRVIGFALTNSDATKNLFDGNLHSWIEYYYNDQWYLMDPTFGQNIKHYDYFENFDLNHFALVKNGYDSYQPTAIGEDFFINKTKNLFISFSQEKLENILNKQDVVVQLKKKDIFNFNLPSYSFNITNKTGKLIKNIDLSLDYDKNNFDLDINDNFSFDLLPFEKKKIFFKVYQNQGSQNNKLELNYQLNHQSFQFAKDKFHLTPTSWVFRFISPRWLLLIAFIVFLFLTFFANFFIFKKRKKRRFN